MPESFALTAAMH